MFILFCYYSTCFNFVFDVTKDLLNHGLMKCIKNVNFNCRTWFNCMYVHSYVSTTQIKIQNLIVFQKFLWCFNLSQFSSVLHLEANTDFCHHQLVFPELHISGITQGILLLCLASIMQLCVLEVFPCCYVCQGFVAVQHSII